MSAPRSALLEPALAWSTYLRLRISAAPDFAEWLSTAASRKITPAIIDDWVRELGLSDPHAIPSIDAARVMLRQLRQRIFSVVMARDLAGLANLEEVTGAMTALADLAVGLAYRCVASELAAVHGVPHEADSGRPQEMLIMGMGKLGGCELNVSSDIDLVMLYGDEGETTGRRPLSHHEFYGRLTRRMMPVLSEIDHHGFVFRTDLRLRPDGEVGPLAWSLDAFEHYLLSQGRDWERYAWLKARRIQAQAFPDSDVSPQLAQLEGLRRPFVFRKYFDFDALLSLRALRERIRNDWNRRATGRTGSDPAQADNVKLGAGGIREIEFIVQLSQLIRGGRNPALQARGLLDALQAERDAGLISPADAERLQCAYRFLRRLEHTLQYREDQQTHLLPQAADQREALARTLGFASTQAFQAELDQHRDFVEATFCDVFRLAGLPSDQGGEGRSGDCVPFSDTDADTSFTDYLRLRFPDDAEMLLRRVASLLASPRIKALPDRSRQQLDALLPATVDAALATRSPAVALKRLIDLVEQVAQRRVYLTLLAEYPLTLARVARMMAASEWVAQYLMRHPLLLDSLIDWHALMEVPNFTQIAQQLSAALDGCLLPDGEPDVERQMNIMRDTQRQVSFHVLAQDLEGSLSVETTGDYLSSLADLMLEQTLRRVWPQVARTNTEPPRFAVIAYGKLGGKELGYESDLDLVFLFDDEADDYNEDYVRFARRIVSWLNSMTSSGRLYDVDLRLRPDGDAGLVAASLSGFERYQRKDAWSWEHQALTRARFVVGDAAVGARFEAIRREVLLLARDQQQLARDVCAMRQRISHGHPNRTEMFDIKHDSGGMVDIEFVTQYLVLLHSRQHPQLLDNLGNIALLRLAGEAGLIPPTLAARVGDAYRTLRREQHALRLQGADKARIDPGLLAEQRAVVSELWRTVFPATHESA